MCQISSQALPQQDLVHTLKVEKVSFPPTRMQRHTVMTAMWHFCQVGISGACGLSQLGQLQSLIQMPLELGDVIF
jgi:hypothetical protein